MWKKHKADNLDGVLRMIQIANDNNTLLEVNYIRSFDPEIHKFKTLISGKIIGQIYKGVK